MVKTWKDTKLQDGTFKSEALTGKEFYERYVAQFTDDKGEINAMQAVTVLEALVAAEFAAGIVSKIKKGKRNE